jgi:hypothetical protein
VVIDCVRQEVDCHMNIIIPEVDVISHHVSHLWRCWIGTVLCLERVSISYLSACGSDLPAGKESGISRVVQIWIESNADSFRRENGSAGGLAYNIGIINQI